MTQHFRDDRPGRPFGPDRRKARPALEGLEDRLLMWATNGGAWTYGSRITYSFVPDGTSIGGVASNLYSTLNNVAPTATWQQAIEKAAAVWSSYANINLALVSDNGAPLGGSGNQQDDPQFGDIRIGMIPQAAGTLAFATLPPPYNGGPDAGDIVFNSNTPWQVNSNYDLETVAIHELGHALGMDHSAVTSAVMYAYYNNIKQSLTSDDVAGIQSVYGAYPCDTSNTNSFSTARNISGLINSSAQISLGGLSIAGGADKQYFVVTVPANTTGTMTVSMQSSNLSSLSPQLVVYNAAHSSIGSASLANSFGATATVTITGVAPGQQYFFRAGAASSLGSYGAYGLLVNFGSTSQAPIPPPNTVVLQQPDQGGGSETLNPGGTTADPPGVVSIGTIKAFGDVDQVPGLANAWGLTSGDRLVPNGLSIPSTPIDLTSAQAQAAVRWLDGLPAAVADAMAPIVLAPWSGPATQAVDAALAAWGFDGSSSSPTDPAKPGRYTDGSA